MLIDVDQSIAQAAVCGGRGRKLAFPLGPIGFAGFQCPARTSGVHTVSVQARVDTDGTGDFRAFGAVGKGTLTVEEVRLIKGEDVVAVE